MGFRWPSVRKNRPFGLGWTWKTLTQGTPTILFTSRRMRHRKLSSTRKEKSAEAISSRSFGSAVCLTPIRTRSINREFSEGFDKPIRGFPVKGYGVHMSELRRPTENCKGRKQILFRYRATCEKETPSFTRFLVTIW